MYRKFYREKNAKSILGAKLIQPTKEELLVLLQEKLHEKFEQIKVINNKKMREKYLKNKNKYELSFTMPEQKVKNLLTERVCIDIYEILQILSKLKPINLNLSKKYNYKDLTIANKMQMAANDNVLTNIPELFNLLINLCLNHNFSLEDIEISMKNVQYKEGSFENGLIVEITKS
jgi:hypothetical protein